MTDLELAKEQLIKDECTSVVRKGDSVYFSKARGVKPLLNWLDDKMVFNDLGDEYKNSTKSNLIINFDFYDKETIKVIDNEINIDYYLSKEETLKGLNKDYYSETGVFKLDIPSLVENGYKKEILFNNKKIIFTFYNEKIEGTNKVFYLFINEKYKNKEVYFNSDYSKCNLQKDEEYCNGLILKDEIHLKGLGNIGKYDGNNGDLIIKNVFSSKKDFEYVSDVKEIETSKMFNMLGGKINGVRHYGFKGNNCRICFNNECYLLTGKGKNKLKLKEYFLFKIISLFLWLVIPVSVMFMDYSESMFITLISIFVFYLVIVNALMEVKV